VSTWGPIIPTFPARHAAAALALALALAAALAAPGASARLDSARAEPRAGALALLLRFDAAVTSTVTERGAELVLQVDQPLDGAALERLGPTLEGWVREFRYGYDSLLLGLEPGVRAQVQTAGEEIRVLLERPPAPAPQAAPDDGSQLRLERLRAQLRGERGDRLGARAELERLRRQHPEVIPIPALLAEHESALGRWRRALALHDRVLELDPDAAAAIRSKAQLRREHGTFLRLDQELVDISDADEQHITRLDGRVNVGPRASVEIALERRLLRTPFAQRANGASGAFDGERLRGAALLRLDTTLGELALAAYAGESSPGAGVEWSAGSNYGRTTLRAEAARPYWDFVEGIVDGGTRSLIEAEQRLALPPRWQLSASGALIRYGIDDSFRAADSWRLRAGASYVVHPQAPFLSLAYRLDTEHVLSRRTRSAADGTVFAPLPVTSRESHTLELFASHPLTDYLGLDLVAGYLVDRLNSRGPFAELALRYEPLPTLEMGLRLGRSFTAARGGDSALLRAGGYLMLRM